MQPIVDIRNLTKTYASGHAALKGATLAIDEGEILALLGPNGAGKTTLISIVCGIVNPSSGSVSVAGHDILSDWRHARSAIGLVPQEIALPPFDRVLDALAFTRGLFGLPDDPALTERVLRALSLWDKRNARINELSGGMKRRVLIAKALIHEPKVLFLDEPTAGVDVELRRDMWALVEELRAAGTTIILTTHYIEEAEAIADRIGVINRGEILLVEEKAALMKRLGRKELEIELRAPLDAIPGALAGWSLSLSDDGERLIYDYDTQGERTGIARLLSELTSAGLVIRDLRTRQSSLEEIFVDMVKEKA